MKKRINNKFAAEPNISLSISEWYFNRFAIVFCTYEVKAGYHIVIQFGILCLFCFCMQEAPILQIRKA